MKNRQDSLEKARDYAFLLLKFRLRSERELFQRLKRKGFPEPAIRETLRFLRAKNFIDDEAFARMWMVSRLKRPFGLRRIQLELRTKGVDKEIIDNQIRKIRDDYPEQEIVARLAKTKLEKMKGLEAPVAKRRVIAYLLRRGFPPETVADVMRQLL